MTIDTNSSSNWDIISPTTSKTNAGGTSARWDYAGTILSDEYNLSGLSYPEDLMDNAAYGRNRVIFYINVSVDSRVLKSGSNEVAVVEGVSRDMRGALIGQQVSAAQNIGGQNSNIAMVTAAGMAGAGAGGIVGAFAGTGSFKTAALTGAATGGTAAKMAWNEEASEGIKKEPMFTRPQKRLKAAIALYIPNQLNTRYSVEWGAEDTMMLSALASGAEEVAKYSGESSSKNRSLGIAGDVLQSMGMDKGPAGLGIAAGVATNPKKEQAFKSVDFRTFSFDYQFAPKSASEAENVLNIIRAFKYHMHPEFKSTSDFLYIYPSEFDIVYYKGSAENLNIHRHTSCVLTELNVNYSPNGVFSTFPNGMPTQISVQLTFKELMLLTKESIEKYT